MSIGAIMNDQRDTKQVARARDNKNASTVGTLKMASYYPCWFGTIS